MLLVEIEDHYKRLTAYSQAATLETDPKGKEEVVFVTAAEVATTRFDATLARQGLLPVEVLRDLHEYYADIRIVMEEEKNFAHQTRLFTTSAKARELAGRLIPRLRTLAQRSAWFGF